MKIRSVRFANQTPIPTPGRSKEFTSEAAAGPNRVLESMVVDGVPVIAIKVPGQRISYVPMVGNVVAMEVDEMVPVAAPAKESEVHEGRHSTGAPAKK